MTTLHGKVALITGASSGLGAAAVTLFAERGATVFGVARDENKLAEVFAPITSGAYSQVDITTPGACAAAVESCVDAFGRLDVLVNVAGSHTMRHTAWVTDEDWDRDLAVNLNGPFYLIRASLPFLLDAGGSIINVSSVAGTHGQAYSAGYCAAKHGLVGLTRALAVEFTADKIRINAVCPGGMLTPQVTNFSLPDGADPSLVMRTASPRGLLEPDVAAEMIAFLASDAAAAIHGAVIAVDNGRSAD
ncbi:SDR family NAD(P)-dependent oxidoreductase [Mycobacterium spongiae]|uniref:SDR family oxidoreductase n=1 Tax=Mycobacterium spongiae TaxID=886343 RepID=A0A975K1Q9_9MYCO|nr:SDR family oxidoreductase [Mycobacterium spongiae]QUR69766.1 SDR family oxidoreductase [Mycobacterium spongiae]